MATYFDCSGAQPFEIQDRDVSIQLNEDGSVDLITGGCDMGTNFLGTCAQIAAEVLGLHYEDIHIVAHDTDSTLWDPGQMANSGCYGVGTSWVANRFEFISSIQQTVVVVSNHRTHPAV